MWCVSLHGAWTIISAKLICDTLPQEPSEINPKNAKKLVENLLASVIPPAIIHGLYNTACFQESLIMWPIGIASFIVAHIFIEKELRWSDDKQTSYDSIPSAPLE